MLDCFRFRKGLDGRRLNIMTQKKFNKIDVSKDELNSLANKIEQLLNSDAIKTPCEILAQCTQFKTNLERSPLDCFECLKVQYNHLKSYLRLFVVKTSYPVELKKKFISNIEQ